MAAKAAMGGEAGISAIASAVKSLGAGLVKAQTRTLV